jgi:AraC-like DNA-binding protein
LIEAVLRSGSKSVQSTDGITRAQFVAPHPDLRPYITTYYLAEVSSADGEPVTDLLHPEWGSVRYVCDGAVSGGAQPGPIAPVPPVTLIGHSSRAARIECISMRIASFGLLPLGWHRFVGLPAHAYADGSVDARGLKSAVDFAALFPAIAAARDVAEIASIFDNVLLTALLTPKHPEDNDFALMQRLHDALLDSEVSSVTEIMERLAITGTQLERLSKRVFGFPPKLLLRRQRFLRTLANLMRRPNAKWADILDPQYHDQAHFNRDFRRFFGMAPSQYVALDKPIVLAGAMARMAALGDPLQGLHTPKAR